MSKSTSDKKNKQSQAPPPPQSSQQGFKFPTEQIDLPSGGAIYGKDSPLANGKLEIKYMTAREEDILTSQNLIQQGVVIDKLLESLIVDKSIKIDDMLIGDKNAILVAARISGYGPGYETSVTCPSCQTLTKHRFDLNLEINSIFSK